MSCIFTMPFPPPTDSLQQPAVGKVQFPNPSSACSSLLLLPLAPPLIPTSERKSREGPKSHHWEFKSQRGPSLTADNAQDKASF